MRAMDNPVKCYRCGSCCKATVAMVPATKESDISPDLIESLYKSHCSDYVNDYLDKHSMFAGGGRCQWLIDEEDGTTTCAVHDKRGSDCRNYPDPTSGSTYCKVGKMYSDMGFKL